jgi:hypothetical protein
MLLRSADFHAEGGESRARVRRQIGVESQVHDNVAECGWALCGANSPWFPVQ